MGKYPFTFIDMQKTSNFTIFLATVVSLGGFLFGFDAGIISGVMNFVGPFLDLTDGQEGAIVAAPTLAAMFAMLVAGKLSDVVGRRILLIIVAFLYALSAIWSAYAGGYEALYAARLIGGIAFGAALVIAPTFIAEISSAERRGSLVSIQQLNIVLGFFAAFLCNAYLNGLNNESAYGLTDDTVWRWMLGLEFFPAILYFILLFFVPRSPRWLFLKGKTAEAEQVLVRLHGETAARREADEIIASMAKDAASEQKTSIWDLFAPKLRFILWVGIAIGILQQVTGINAIYFYATSIFKQTGIGTDAAFTSGVWLSLTSVIFTVVAIFLIDRIGRRKLLLAGIGGIAITMLLCAYSFKQATYTLSTTDIAELTELDGAALAPLAGQTFDNDITFKNAMKTAVGEQAYKKYEGDILERATTMNAIMVMIGILGFVACFAFSLGPVMWVMLSEMFPNAYRGLAIGFIGFINGFASWGVSRFFPWELSNLGSSLTFLIYGVIAALGFLLFLRVLPETKGKTLEEIEREYVK
ncbi:MAG: SP family arabinose:H+ symporter-like MFS transporter [Neolewinella sp.]